MRKQLPPSLTDSFIHSFIHSFRKRLLSSRSLPHPTQDEEEFDGRVLSRGAHLIPFNSFWGFSTPGGFINLSGDG